ncbi:MAG: colanic acid biosynthesis glycosyltransferase WcaL [Planctomycetota bacterium]|nr:MAG: colanic acid biosynthesis glycosyltransferase WcaL [Planctomycetota bacterium]
MTAPKVTYLLKKFPRLSETFILNELLALQGQGLELSVLSRREPDDEPRHPELAGLGAPVDVLPSWRSLDPWSLLFGADVELREALATRLPGVLASFGAFGHPRMPSLLAEAVYLFGRCREQGVRHLHVHFATDAAVVACLLEALGGPGYSLTLHAKDIYRETVDPALLARLVGNSRFSVTVCDANVRHITQLLGEAAARRLRRHYNGIDVSALSDAPTHPGARDAEHILAVGRLVPKKGFSYLLEAMSQLLPRRPGLRLTLVGDGDDRPALEARSAELGLSSVVTFTGARDQGEVRKLLSHATLMALPCVVAEDGNRDALPTVLLEALAAGLPVVSTPVTGIPEIVDDGRAGRLVPERDVAGLARALDELLSDADERGRLARAGRQRARQLFNMHSNASVLAEWFRHAVPERAAVC